jgi:hypothetical protein
MNWWSRLGTGQRIGLAAAALLLPCCGGLSIIAAWGGDDGPAASAGNAAVIPSLAPSNATSTATSNAPSNAPSEAPNSVPTGKPSTVKKKLTETKAIPFKKRQIKDDDLPKGERAKRTDGVKGERTLTYEVTLVDGRETGRKLLTSKVTRKPVTEVVAVGTHEEPDDSGGGCTPGYSPCVPVASDVDCAGGSGNGPGYVDGPIRVTGSDPYDLDRDGDGIACDT